MERASGAVSVLAIDTATRSRVVVAVATPAGEQIRGVVMSDDAVGTLLPRGLSGLLPLVSAAVVVVTGPGTYTGVRAGMAGALGIAQALDLPLFGIGSLEVAACSPHPALDGDAWVIADAGRGALYVARRSAAATPQRIDAAAFDAGGAPVVSSEALPIEGVIVVDPVRALAASVALALSRDPLDRTGLTALYVD
jgi:tRNA A37 threonylcarbamoyladenosine modification protein TsaB